MMTHLVELSSSTLVRNWVIFVRTNIFFVYKYIVLKYVKHISRFSYSTLFLFKWEVDLS